jgi:hypothetical protein
MEMAKETNEPVEVAYAVSRNMNADSFEYRGTIFNATKCVY